MPHDPRVIELLLRYEELQEQGRGVTPEELCRDCPDLLDALRRDIAALSLFERRLGPPEQAALIDPLGGPLADGPALPATVHPGGPATPPAHGPAAVPGEPPAGRAGRYQLEEELARGGMGAVWRARDPELGRTLAVKVLREDYRGRPDLGRRFREEAQITGQLQHPGIPPVHEVGTLADGRPFFAMKLIKGRTLADLLSERSAPAADLPRFLGIFEQVCQAVAYAHSKGVIHRDLKPHNVMVGAFGEVQVMDWGLAKVLGDRGSPNTGKVEEVSAIVTDRAATPGWASQPGAQLGTPAYMAPEQARGEVDRLDERCDVFGLGAILCVLLIGQPPFRGGSLVLLR
jgi:serine/threonine-protein kinase